MKFRITPLLIISICFFICGVLMFFGLGGNLGPLSSIMYFFPGGIICLLLYFVFKGAFAYNYRRQVLVETIFLTVLSFGYYRIHERILLHTSPDFHGYIVIVYGVDNKPEIKNHSLFNPDIDILIPDNGIFFTSSNRSENLRLMDNSGGRKKILEPGYGISFDWDTLKCYNKEYTLDIIYFAKDWTGWVYNSESDRANRILKKDLARKILRE